MSEDRLDGSKVAVLIAPRGTEEPEFADTRRALEDAGAAVSVLSTEAGAGDTVNGDLDPGGSYDVDSTVGSANPGDFAAVVIPGGTVGADRLRMDDDVVGFVKAFLEAGKPVASICHGPWVLIETGAVEGRTLTSFPSLRTDLRNAGANWVDEEVVVRDGLVTSRNPDDLPAFTEALVAEIAAARASSAA